MPLKDTEKHPETEDQLTTPYLRHLRNIFSEEFITANQSKFYTKDGKIDFKKLEQVLVKEGYSEEFARRLVNDLKNEKIKKTEDISKYKLTAKFDLNRERLEEIYGKHGAKVARAVLDFFENNGDIKSEYFIRLLSMAGTLESWKEFSEVVQMDLSNYALSKISERELREQIGEIKIIREREFETLELELARAKVLAEYYERGGKQDYEEKIVNAKNMQELKKAAIESGLYNEVTWNNLVNEIANMIMKHAEMLPYEQQQLGFITQIVLYYYQQAIYEEIENKKEESEKRNRNRSDGELEEERKMREFAKAYVDVLKADGKAADIETLIINNLRENEKRLNNIAENFMGMMDGNGKMKEEEMRVLETLAGKRPPVDFATHPGICGKNGQHAFVEDGGPHIRVKELAVG